MIGSMQLSLLAQQLEGELFGDDANFDSVTIDTRAMKSGDLYVAIKGLNFDGNDFVAAADKNGASGAIVEKVANISLPQILIKDGGIALGQIAHFNRQRSNALVIGITGSQGKTTVKEMVGQILSLSGNTLVTRGNLNNAIGVPLTLLEIEQEHKYCVAELGASGAGEIEYSVGLVEPDVVAITCADKAHIEGFGNLDGVASAKGEIIDGVGVDGCVVLNLDDKYYSTWKDRANGRKVASFSLLSKKGDYHATDLSVTENGLMRFMLHSPVSRGSVNLKLLGKHNVINALAATAVAMEAGASFNQVVEGLEKVEPVRRRLHPLKGLNEATLIDDSYNASPSSFRAAIDVLADCQGHRILVMGEMSELGDETVKAHQELGYYAKEAGIDQLLSIGSASSYSAACFGPGSLHFENKSDLIIACKEKMKKGVTLLVKGSRSAGMDEIVDALAIK